MKNIWLITKTNLKRNKFAVLLSFLGAAMLCLILYSMGDLVTNITLAKISVGVIDEDDSALSKDFKKYLTEQLDYNLVENYTFDELSTELIDKNISVIIEIPENFFEAYSTGNKENLIVTSLEDYENAAFLEIYINNYLSSIQILSQGAAGDPTAFDQLLQDYNKEDIALSLSAAEEINQKELKGSMGFINSVGFYLMFIFSVSVLLSFMILEDRFSGVFNRIQATPVKPIQYIIGSGIFGLILCFIEVGLYCGYIFVMDVKIGVPMWSLILIMSLFSLFTVSISLAAALALRSKSATTSIIIGFSTVGCILGGAYFPLDLAPKTLQNIARVLPQYWFMDAFRDLQADVTANIYPNVVILALFAALSILMGAVLFAQNYKNS